MKGQGPRPSEPCGGRAERVSPEGLPPQMSPLLLQTNLTRFSFICFSSPQPTSSSKQGVLGGVVAVDTEMAAEMRESQLR